MTVRAAREGDAEAMAKIYVAAAREAWAHIYSEAYLASLEPPDEHYRSAISSLEPRSAVLVAEDQGRVVAFAVIRPSQDQDSDPDAVGELNAFYSDPSVWGRGIGRDLLGEVIEALQRNGFSEATLWTAEQNHRPRRIYEAAGWEFDGTNREKMRRGTNSREIRYRITLETR
jgi:RimJ/RimL family protein N-acetyltransferase